MKLDNVVPWGRSFAEYRSMFDLTEADLRRSILGCGDGPASFNAELSLVGGKVVSVDPVYQFTGDQIRSRIDEVYPQIISQMEKSADNYLWESIKDVEELGRVRMAAMQQFLTDYDFGLRDGRYQCASLPHLPFADQQFKLALCSHFLFLYSDHFNLEQHIRAMRELCRVAAEVRVYPLVSLDGKESRHLPEVVEDLAESGCITSFRSVSYQFQKGATVMLVVNAAK